MELDFDKMNGLVPAIIQDNETRKVLMLGFMNKEAYDKTVEDVYKRQILGYGVYQVTPEECERCVLDAISVGYRSIDTAQAYYNEEGVGNAVRKCGVPREELFITTKVWISNGGYEKAKVSIDESLRKLQSDYVDLLLIHQPFNDYYGTYRAMEEAYKDGKARALSLIHIYAPSHKGYQSIARWYGLCYMDRYRCRRYGADRYLFL